VSGFFQSEIVREAIKEMEELQQRIIQDTFKAPIMSKRTKEGTCRTHENFSGETKESLLSSLLI
jgi:hypothetical protein